MVRATVRRMAGIALTHPLVRRFMAMEFARYFFVGVIATLADWGSFYLFSYIVKVHYAIALSISVILGSGTNFILNKIFTFRDRSRQIAGQLSVFIAVSVISLSASLAIMYLFVDILSHNRMVSRILTSFIMLVANYFMHKHATFNRAVFR